MFSLGGTFTLRAARLSLAHRILIVPPRRKGLLPLPGPLLPKREENGVWTFDPARAARGQRPHPYQPRATPWYLFSAMVGMARCAVPARVVAGGTNIQATLALEGVAPLHAARTSQRDVPTTLNRNSASCRLVLCAWKTAPNCAFVCSASVFGETPKTAGETPALPISTEYFRLTALRGRADESPLLSPAPRW